MVKLEDFNYTLPESAIAKYPPEIRGQSRLLVIDRTTREISDHKYQDFADFAKEGDVVVLNDTKVLPARVFATSPAGKRVELVMQESHAHQLTSATSALFIYRGKLKPGEVLNIGTEIVSVESIQNKDEVGLASIKLEGAISWSELLHRFGEPPIPPYLERDAERIDRERYQTVFANLPGAVAAPTASLNFTTELLEKLVNKGVKVVYLTLHVGLGTFLPIRVLDVSKHKMHQEYFEIPALTAKEIRTAKVKGSKIWAIGTTVTRTLEYAATEILASTAESKSITGEADIFIYPGGYEFKIVDHLLTNFHAPKSTVLMLTATFAGWDILDKAYRHALAENYKFLSYGDSMLLI